MTSFLRRIRNHMDEIAAARSRPLLLSARVPGTLRLSAGIGLALESWLREDLVDMLIAGGDYTPFTLPVTDFIRAARPYGVPVCPCINAPPLLESSEDRFPEAVRAPATRWYSQGAGGKNHRRRGSKRFAATRVSSTVEAMRIPRYKTQDTNKSQVSNSKHQGVNLEANHLSYFKSISYRAFCFLAYP